MHGVWRKTIIVTALGIGLLAQAPASAQLGLGGGLPGGGLPGALGGLLDPLPGTVDGLVSGVQATAGELARRHLDRLRDLVRENPRDLDLDPDGALIIRDEILALSPTPESLDRAARLGFEVSGRETLAELGLELVTLRPPRGQSARQVLRDLKRADPAGSYDYNHVYQGAGEAGPSGARLIPAQAARPAPATNVVVGLVDTGVDTTHPAFAGVRIEQRGFAPGGVKAADHGTSVASLLGGRMDGFSGAAPGARLLVADVYGSGPRGGSAQAIASGLNWIGESGAVVVNVSLVGPPNLLLKASIDRLAAKGVLVVAPVGNDGPAAPASYPASYPGVVSVTGVDGRNRVLIEAGKALHVDFAAPGADIRAAVLGGRLAAVRGTSFAAPIVAGRLAMAGRGASAIPALGSQATDLGSRGADRVFGRGLVGADLRPAQSATGR